MESLKKQICPKLFSDLSYFILGFESGINMKFDFFSSGTQNRASFLTYVRLRVCVRACVFVCLRERETERAVRLLNMESVV